MQARKPKFQGKKTKWEKRRIVKRLGRKEQGKKPLAESLVIASLAERKAALKRGSMVFYDGKKKIELRLSIGEPVFKERLIGVYKLPEGKIISFRASPHIINAYELKGGIYEKPFFVNFFERGPDLAHMKINHNTRGHGLGLKIASKAEREQRAKNDGTHLFASGFAFVNLFKKLGYEQVSSWEGLQIARMKKAGKHQPKDDLSKFYRIEAIDPETGKAKMFTFPIEQKKK